MQEQPKVFLVRTPGSRTKFKILTPETQLRLKAGNQKERDEWISKIAEVVREAAGDEGAVIQNEEKTMDEGLVDTSQVVKKRAAHTTTSNGGHPPVEASPTLS